MKTPRFLLSALDAAQFPEPSAPEVAFLGRSNVGKSSLLNALVGSQQAKVSSTPGRTRAINFFALFPDAKAKEHNAPPSLILADLPGYGYAKLSKSISAEWPKFIDPYLTDRPTLALCICLVDTNIPPQESDAQLLAFLRAHQRNFLVVGTKSDKLSSNKLVQSTAALRRELEVDTVLPCSAKTKAGMKELWARLKELEQPA